MLKNKRHFYTLDKIHQGNVKEILDGRLKPISTPMITSCKLNKEDEYKEVDQIIYRAFDQHL